MRLLAGDVRARDPGAPRAVTEPQLGQEDKDKILAAYDMLSRMGAASVELRFSEPDAEVGGPVVWVACFQAREKMGGGWEVDASLHPARALLRLLERLADGGRCTHCGRPTGLDPDHLEMPLDQFVCWYLYDPELKKFRRGCEGDAP